jgi:hypothetical protein
MKSGTLRLINVLAVFALFVAVAPTSLASTTWYVNGANGNDSNDCKSPTTACKTIVHAISLAASGDSILVASATYPENLTIGISLNVIGSGSNTTIIDGGSTNRVVTISNSSTRVTLSNVTIRHGLARYGGGIYNSGTLTIIASALTGNRVSPPNNCFFGCGASGGGIYNGGTLTISNSTVSGNTAYSMIGGRSGVGGGGIYNSGILTINNSTLSGNSATEPFGSGEGGGIGNSGTANVNNSTITGNNAAGESNAPGGGGISNTGNIVINNSTIAGNGGPAGGGIQNFNGMGATARLQNSIVANSPYGGNCSGIMTSKGYNLSSDSTCNFNGPGDLNSHDPVLGTFGYYGGPTQTIPLLSGSPAIDAGNPSGCTDSQGNLLKTDQRGMPRPDKEDSVGCDMGAYESPKD